MESRDISLLQNYLSVAFEPGCLSFSKLLGEAERDRNQCLHGSEDLGRGARRGRHHCWGRAGIVLGELY